MERLEYIFETKLIYGYDGDTLTMLDDLGHGVSFKSKVRLSGINTPELRGGTSLTKQAAKLVRDYVREWCGEEALTSVSYKDDLDKYGRWLIRLYKGDVMLNDHLLKMGFAQPYDGGAKIPWSASQINNIIKALT